MESHMKIPPPIFKGIPGECPDAHVFAVEDWMEAMHFRENQYIDKFKHTLNHLAREWYHSLDLDEFGKNSLELSVGTFDSQDHRGKFGGNKGRFKPRRPLGKFNRSPNTKCPRVSGKAVNKDKVRCYKCREFGHYKDECPTNNKSQKDDSPCPKKFEDYTYTYSGPDIQPQMHINAMHPNMNTAYE